MRRIKMLLLCLLVILIVIQFIQPPRNKSDQLMPDNISKVVSMPAKVQGILQKACYDCHSNNTRYPWYANVQPFRWILEDHIQSGKAELNFNEFAAYTSRRQQNKLRSMENSLLDGTMPPSSYTLIHRDAILSKAEKVLLLSWIEQAKGSLAQKKPTNP